MKTWVIWGDVSGRWKLGEVQANTEEEALEKGEKLDTYCSLCHACADDLDLGEIQDLTAEEDCS